MNNVIYAYTVIHNLKDYNFISYLFILYLKYYVTIIFKKIYIVNIIYCIGFIVITLLVYR